MAGGIQKGMVATDTHARNLDIQCKTFKDKVYAELADIAGLTMQKKLEKDQIPGDIGACEPDGGAWFYNGKLIAIFEGKKQQNRGNAIERWFKNNFICRAINSEVSYVTFAIGEGAVDNGVITKALNIAHLDGFDKYVPGKNSCFRSVNGFTNQEIYDTMISVILERINGQKQNMGFNKSD